MSRLMHGIVHGRTIELTDDPGVPEGQEVRILVTAVVPREEPWGAGLRRCAGAMADEWTDEDDRILERLQHERHCDPRPEAAP